MTRQRGSLLTAILLAGGLVGACSASDNTTPADDSGTDAIGAPDDVAVDHTAVDANKDSTTPPDSGAPIDGGDAQSIDAQATDGDAAFGDAPADALAEAGSTCSPVNAIQSQACGMCGQQTRVCLGTPPVWQPWGFCQNEVPGGCVPGSSTTSACGFCGTLMKVCQNDCTYAASACTGQVANGCVVGTTDYELDPTCDAGLGKARTCMAGCTWGPFTSCEAPPASLTISTSVGGVVDTIRDLSASTKILSLNKGSCPTTLTTTSTPYHYVNVYNATGQTAVVSIWSSQATATSPIIDTIMTTYPSASAPATVAQRDACTGTVNDTCFDISNPTSCQASWAGLMLGDNSAVTIAPGATIDVYTAVLSSTGVGEFRLSVRTESLQ